MEKLLTIIISVYRVEAYINKCLDSLIVPSELMQKLEVIIVNDGSPDKSAEMSREYVKRYPGIFRQIDKENGGHGSTWNIGLRDAAGKYLRFLDSDDWFTNLDKLMLDLEGCEADIIYNPYIKEYSYENRMDVVDVPVVHKIERIDPGHLFHLGYNNVNFWSATYKTKILKPLLPLFAEKTTFDDFILTWAPLVHGRTYFSLNYPIYHYLIGRPGQSMSSTRQRKGAVAYLKCFGQYESVRSGIDSKAIPSDLLNCIDDSIVGYANFIFPYMVYLPLKEAQNRMTYLWRKYLSSKPNKSILLKRYAKMPGIVFYFFEHLRRKIRN